MHTAEIIVTLVGLCLSAFVIWFFFFAPKKQVRTRTSGNVQEIRIRVDVRDPHLGVVDTLQAGEGVGLLVARPDGIIGSIQVIAGAP